MSFYPPTLIRKIASVVQLSSSETPSTAPDPVRVLPDDVKTYITKAYLELNLTPTTVIASVRAMKCEADRDV